MNNFKKGLYKHFSGRIYEVIDIALHSETLEELVLYRALYGSEMFGDNRLWVRPKEMFFEKIFFDSIETPRFKYIGES